VAADSNSAAIIFVMRLDQFLKISRLIPRRSLAQEFCDKGLINVNGVKAKSSKEVKVDDEIEINRHNRSTRVLVNAIPASKQVAKDAAGSFYEVLEDSRIEDDLV
jgi:ribosomal 50S subunit-recycling heat shock protein